MSIRVAINGFGRIGRSIARAFFEIQPHGIEIIAINGPADISQHAHLFEFDSVHAKFNANIEYDDNHLIVNGNKIKVFKEKDIKNLPWKELKIDVVMECTGLFTSKEKAALHIESGARKVIISAPAKEKDIKTIVLGVNNDALSATDNIISIGSCTTNALAPLCKILDQKIGIVKGFMTTVHAFTSDQNLLDSSHKSDLRRARAATLSMIPTSTGAARALSLVLPNMGDKIDGSAIRVPCPNVSVIDFTFLSERKTNIMTVNSFFEEASAGSMKGILGVEARPLVSIDFNHNIHSSVVDLMETKVIGENFVRVLSWYDNEWGFSLRMLEAAALLTSLG